MVISIRVFQIFLRLCQLFFIVEFQYHKPSVITNPQILSRASYIKKKFTVSSSWFFIFALVSNLDSFFILWLILCLRPMYFPIEIHYILLLIPFFCSLWEFSRLITLFHEHNCNSYLEFVTSNIFWMFLSSPICL